MLLGIEGCLTKYALCVQTDVSRLGHPWRNGCTNFMIKLHFKDWFLIWCLVLSTSEGYANKSHDFHLVDNLQHHIKYCWCVQRLMSNRPPDASSQVWIILTSCFALPFLHPRNRREVKSCRDRSPQTRVHCDPHLKPRYHLAVFVYNSAQAQLSSQQSRNHRTNLGHQNTWCKIHWRRKIQTTKVQWWMMFSSTFTFQNSASSTKMRPKQARPQWMVMHSLEPLTFETLYEFHVNAAWGVSSLYFSPITRASAEVALWIWLLYSSSFT